LSDLVLRIVRADLAFCNNGLISGEREKISPGARDTDYATLQHPKGFPISGQKGCRA
jgi:hypothetical protein